MALGTITQLVDQPNGLFLPANMGTLKVTFSTVVGDSSYPTGGTALTAQQLGLGSLIVAKVVGVQGSAANNTAVSGYFNNSTGKLQCFATTGTSPVGLAEAANTTNLSGLTFLIEAYGQF